MRCAEWPKMMENYYYFTNLVNFTTSYLYRRLNGISFMRKHVAEFPQREMAAIVHHELLHELRV